MVLSTDEPHKGDDDDEPRRPLLSRQRARGARRHAGGFGALRAAQRDFSLLGGRTQWLAYLRESPVYWRVFGLPITPAVLQSLVAGSAGSVLASAASLAYSAFKTVER